MRRGLLLLAFMILLSALARVAVVFYPAHKLPKIMLSILAFAGVICYAFVHVVFVRALRTVQRHSAAVACRAAGRLEDTLSTRNKDAFAQ